MVIMELGWDMQGGLYEICTYQPLPYKQSLWPFYGIRFFWEPDHPKKKKKAWSSLHGQRLMGSKKPSFKRHLLNKMILQKRCNEVCPTDNSPKSVGRNK